MPSIPVPTLLRLLDAERLPLAGDWSHRAPWPGLHTVLLRRQLPAPGWQAPPFALPAQLIAGLPRAVPKRQQEFLLGRLAAHEALKAAGCPATQAWAGQAERRPVWPAGMTGSLSHTDSLVLAVAASTSTGVRSVGVDLESLAPDPEAVRAIEACFDEDERRGLAACPHGLLAGFALKESLYKCLQPLVGGWIDFEDAWVRWSGDPSQPARLTLRKTLAPAFPAGHELQGSVGFFEEHVVAAVAC